MRIALVNGILVGALIMIMLSIPGVSWQPIAANVISFGLIINNLFHG